MNGLNETLTKLQPQLLSVLRIIAGLLFLQHGLVKMFGFPMAFPNPVGTFSMLWFAAAIELVTGIALILGFMTRPAAFLASGLMAFAYFIGHSPRSFYPIQNGGNLAILYCFTFLYLTAAGPGPWSLDARNGKA